MLIAATCLALNMYFEARNEGHVGMFAVGLVTLNRVESHKYPDNVCDVVWQNKQFSWTHDGKSDDPTRHTAKRDREAWRDAKAIANMLLTEERVYPLQGATMYHAEYVKPYWTKSYTKVNQVGQHIFYKETKR